MHSCAKGHLHSFQIQATRFGVAPRRSSGGGNLLLDRLLDGSQQPFFFLGCPTALLGLDGAEVADLLVDRNELGTDGLEAMKLGDFLLSFAQGGGSGEALGDGLALGLASETKLWVMPWVVRFGAMTGGLAATPHHYADGTGTEITEGLDLSGQLGTNSLQVGQRIGHKGVPPF